MKVVLYFQTPTKTDSSAEKLVGVREIAARVGWHVQICDSTVNTRNLKQLVKFWHPSGIIVECGERTDNVRAFDTLKSVPVVFIDRDLDSVPKKSFCVNHDSRGAGEVAARELLMTGYRNFAFIPFPGVTRRWSEERREGFVTALKTNGLQAKLFATSAKNSDDPRYSNDIGKFLKSIPKPCAVYVANDHTAEKTMTEAQLLHLAIPDSIAILGTDDFKMLCEHTHPPLSSVRPAFRQGGSLAALLLLAAMRDGQHFRGKRQRYYGTIQVVRRGSTVIQRKTGDAETDAALEFIWQEATNGISADQVARYYTCSRPLAAAKFKRATGHTILQEIHAVQLKRIQELLADRDLALKTIHDFCGFKNENSLRKFFLRETGLTMSQWRLKTLRLRSRV